MTTLRLHCIPKYWYIRIFDGMGVFTVACWNDVSFGMFYFTSRVILVFNKLDITSTDFNTMEVY